MQDTPKRVAVIGLGSFGSSLAVELVNQGAEVMAIDSREELVENIKNEVNNAICFDCTNEVLLAGHGVTKFDLVVIAIGENFGSTVTITTILRDKGVRVFSRASSDREERILKALGAEKIFRPEHEQGITRAREITYTGVQEYLKLRSNMELIVTEPKKTMLGKAVTELDIRRNYGINIAFIGKKDEQGNYDYRIPKPDDVLDEGDRLWLIGSNKNMKIFRER
jgi:trk system potassium uptake protein